MFASANMSKATLAIMSGLDDMVQFVAIVRLVILAMVIGKSGERKLTCGYEWTDFPPFGQLHVALNCVKSSETLHRVF